MNILFRMFKMSILKNVYKKNSGYVNVKMCVWVTFHLIFFANIMGMLHLNVLLT